MKRIRAVMTALMALAVVGVAATSGNAFEWGKTYLPNVPVVTQNGDQLHFYDDVVKGKTILFSFIYTSCHDICPVITARLAQVQERLGDALGRDIEFVSVSIDPVTDTPARLKDYAEAFGATRGWTFLTGGKEDMDLLRYKLGERSRTLGEHRNSVLLYNDVTGEWSKESTFSDIAVLTDSIRSMSSALRKDGAAAALATAGVPAMQETSHAELPGQTLFVKTCGVCHTVGRGGKVGPDLAGLATRRSRDWIVSYMIDPQKMRQEKDPIALELMAKYPAVRMPNLSLAATDAADLMAYVAAVSVASGDDKRVHTQDQQAAGGHAEHIHHD